MRKQHVRLPFVLFASILKVHRLNSHEWNLIKYEMNLFPFGWFKRIPNFLFFLLTKWTRLCPFPWHLFSDDLTSFEDKLCHVTSTEENKRLVLGKFFDSSLWSGFFWCASLCSCFFPLTTFTLIVSLRNSQPLVNWILRFSKMLLFDDSPYFVSFSLQCSDGLLLQLLSHPHNSFILPHATSLLPR